MDELQDNHSTVFHTDGPTVFSRLDKYRITATEEIIIHNGHLQSTVERDNEPGGEDFNAAVDIIESFLLILHSEGISVPESAVKAVFEVIEQKYT